MNGSVKLPKSLKLLERLNFSALVERHKNGRITWTVEFSPQLAKAVVEQFDEIEKNINKIKLQNNDLLLANQTLEGDNELFHEQNSRFAEEALELRRENELLRENNEKLMANIERDSKVKNSTYAKSPKTIFDSTISVGLPLQGGLPSLGKRR